MTDSWVRACYPLHRIVFGFLPYPDLFQWNFKKKKIVREKSRYVLTPWVIFMFGYTSFVGIFSPLYLLYSDISGKTSRYNDVQLVCHWIVFMGSWMSVSLAVIHFIYRQGILESSNVMLEFQDRYEPESDTIGLEDTKINWKQDIIGFLACDTVVTMAVGGPFLAMFGVFENVDPMGFLFEIWLPNATNRTWAEILGGIGIRLGTQIIAMSETMRLLSWGIMNTALLACVFMKTLQSLTLISEYSSKEDIHRKLKIYDELFILGNVILPSGKLVIADLFFTGLFAGVILVWPLVKLESIRGTLFFWLIVTVALGIFLFQWVMIPCAAQANEMASGLLKSWKTECEYWHNVDTKYVRRWVRSRRLLSATCYDYFCIDNTTFPTYMNNILDNIINALLLW